MKLISLLLSTLFSLTAFAEIDALPIETLTIQVGYECDETYRKNPEFLRTWYVRAKVPGDTGDFIIQSERFVAGHDGTVYFISADESKIKIGQLTQIPSERKFCPNHGAFQSEVILDSKIQLHLDNTTIQKSCETANFLRFSGDVAKRIQSKVYLTSDDKVYEIADANTTVYRDRCFNLKTIGRGFAGWISLPLVILFPIGC